MAKVFIEESTLTDIADAVRGKNGTTEPIKTVELATAITNLPTGGKNVLELLYTEGAEITAEDWGNANVITGGANNLQMHWGSLFLSTKFKKITFPDTQIRRVGFINGLLEEFDSGNGMTMLLSDPNDGLGFNFNGCENLKRVWFGENFLPFANYTFNNCVSLSEVHYSGTIDKWAEAVRNGNISRANPFFNNKGGSFYLGDSPEPLTEINLTTATKITDGAFSYFVDIEKAVIGETVASIGGNAFQGCDKLNTLILKGDTVKTLSNVTAFSITPIARGTGYIYVPSSLLEEYKAATNWATYAEQFRAIEDYPEILGSAE